MKNLIVLTFISITSLAGLFMLSNCTTDYFSNTQSSTLAGPKKSPKASPFLTYCNKIHEVGFRGLLASYYDPDQKNYTKNTTWLYLWEVPFELKVPSNYVQFHRFYVSNNKEVYNKAPIEAEVIKQSTSEKVSIATVINKDLLTDMGGLSISQLINKYAFLLHDMGGWQGISLSVFDGQDKPVKVTKALIPPFESNPHSFVSKNDQESLLMKLHPFSDIALVKSSNEKVFYEKSKSNCQDSPIPMKIPQFKMHQTTPTPPSAVNNQDELNDISPLLPSFH